MAKYLMSRVVQMVPTLLALSVVVFILLRAIPGDATIALMADSGRYDEQQLAMLRDEWGLDDPVPGQYLTWMGNNLRGNFGHSFYSNRSVHTELFRAFPPTVQIAAMAILISAILGIIFGVISALRRNSILDLLLRTASLTGLAVPNFWVGTLILVLPAYYFGWIPPLTYQPLTSDPSQNLLMFVPAAIALATTPTAVLMRIVRSAMLETLRQDYIRTAYAKGMKASTVMMRHALRNALIPVITVIGIQVAALIGGTVVIETIFNIPGVGRQTLRALEFRDYPQLQFNILFIGIIILGLNIMIDISYGLLDPRIRV